jgi:hypothetical protein
MPWVTGNGADVSLLTENLKSELDKLGQYD